MLSECLCFVPLPICPTEASSGQKRFTTFSAYERMLNDSWLYPPEVSFNSSLISELAVQCTVLYLEGKQNLLLYQCIDLYISIADA